MTSDVLLDQGLPHSVDAEQAILGAVLLNNQLIEQVRELLSVGDFYIPSHRPILEAMLSLHSQRMPIDAVTLRADLEARGWFERVGGLTYIASLIDGVPRNDTISPYARILRRHSRARQFIRACSGAIARATDAEEDVHSIVLDLEREILKVKTEPPDHASIVRRCLADVQAEYVSFLWEPYIPLGKLALIEGDPGVGKSWLACALATATAEGRGPEGWTKNEPANVLLLSVEDGLADTIRPRLDSMRADVTRIHALEGAFTLDDSGLLILENHIVEVTPALVVIDPLVAYIGAGVDLHRANEVRAVTARLALMAERCGCAIVGIRHLSKSGKDRAIYRGLGSIDITAAARSVLLVGCDPDDSAKRAVAHIKSNLAETGGAVGYEIRGGCFYWTGESNLTAQRMLGASTGESERSTRSDAEDFLREALAEGRRPSKEVMREGREAGFSDATLKRAKAALGVKAVKTGQPGTDTQLWSWGLPAEDIQADGEDAHKEADEHLRANSDDNDACDGHLTEAAHESLFEHLRGRDEQVRAEELEVIEL